MAFTCPECGKELDDFEELQRHTRSAHLDELAAEAGDAGEGDDDAWTLPADDEGVEDEAGAPAPQRIRPVVPIAIAIAILAGVLALIAGQSGS